MELDRRERAVLDYLAADWDLPLHLTTIAQAQHALGLADDPPRRLQLGRWLAANPGFHPVVQQWGWLTLTLTGREKRLARQLRRRSAPAPCVRSTGRVIDADRTAALDSLVACGVAAGSGCAGDPAVDAPLGPLGLGYHTVTVGDGAPFDIPCARDAFLLAVARHADTLVCLDGACDWCAAPIRGTFRGETVVEANPADAWYGSGGT